METNSQASVIPAERSASNPVKAISKPKVFSRLRSDEGLTKKASLNALASTLDYGARLVSGFVINPILVSGVGTYLYGVWQILGRLISYASAASGRPTEALKWAVANRQTSTDYQEKRRTVGSALVVWFLFLPLLTVIGGTLAWFAPMLLQAPPEYVWPVRLAAGLLMVDLIITSLLDIPESVLRGENKGYKRMGLTTLLVLFQGGTLALAVILKTGIVGMAVAILIDTLITAALFLYIVRSYVPWFGIARPSRAEVRRFTGLSGWFLIWRLVMQLLMSSDVVVLGTLISPALVTTYVLTKYAPETLISLVAIVMGGITPGLGGVIGSGNVEKAARVRQEFMAGTWLVATVVGTTTLLWNQSFIRLWVGAEHYAGPVPALLVMLMVVQFILIRNDANIIDLTLNLRRKVLIGLLSATIAVVFAGILVGPLNLGIAGLCLGFIAGRSILSVVYPWMIGRLLGVPFTSQLKGILRPTGVTALLFIGVAVLGHTLIAETWLSLVPLVAVTLVTVSFLAFYSGLPSDQRQSLLRRVRLVLRSGKAS